MRPLSLRSVRFVEAIARLLGEGRDEVRQADLKEVFGTAHSRVWSSRRRVASHSFIKGRPRLHPNGERDRKVVRHHNKNFHSIDSSHLSDSPFTISASGAGIARPAGRIAKAWLKPRARRAVLRRLGRGALLAADSRARRRRTRPRRPRRRWRKCHTWRTPRATARTRTGTRSGRGSPWTWRSRWSRRAQPSSDFSRSAMCSAMP
jgi:hypothetical protein